MTAEVISPDGWMATGDLASMDDEVSGICGI
jgi:long-subunit acyl-CoA synthetase (AMP-forming)